MRKLIDKAMDSTKKYTIWDFACLKIALISVGILLGAYFSTFFISYISLIWIIFIASYILIMYRTFKSE